MYPNENEAPSAQDEHDAIWQPILAAHRVAAALRTIADALGQLSAQASDPLYDLFQDCGLVQQGEGYADMLKRQADAVEQAAPLPITPTEEDREAQFDRFYDMDRDTKTKDRVHSLLDQMTEAEKVEEMAQAALDELLDGEGQ